MTPIRYLNFWLFVAALVAVTLLTGPAAGPSRGILFGFDAGALIWIALTLRMMASGETRDMRARAKANDPDAHILLAIAMLIVLVVLVAVTVELTGVVAGHGSALVIAGSTLLLAWLFSNLCLRCTMPMNSMRLAIHRTMTAAATAKNRIAAGSNFPATGCPTMATSLIIRSSSA